MWIRYHHWQLPLIIIHFTCRYLLVSDTGLVCNIEFPSETHLKVKSREISFVYSTRFDNPIVMKCCSEHDIITAILCLAFQKLWIRLGRINTYINGDGETVMHWSIVFYVCAYWYQFHTIRHTKYYYYMVRVLALVFCCNQVHAMLFISFGIISLTSIVTTLHTIR